MVLVAQVVQSICETHNRPLRCGCIEHIIGGRYTHGRDHHPRTRLQRFLPDYAALALEFLAEPTFFTVMDTYGIELIHPRREGCSKRQIGKKGISNGCWIIGIKLAWLINDEGEDLIETQQ